MSVYVIAQLEFTRRELYDRYQSRFSTRGRRRRTGDGELGKNAAFPKRGDYGMR
jgi:hypothetical protein